MKLLILFLNCIFISYTFSQELVDKSTGKEIVSRIKNAEIGDMLEKTAEFRDCREKNKFDSPGDKDQKIKAAEKCFRDKLTNGKNLQQLEELSKTLQLQEYGLIKSKNTTDIQKYLNDKMYKSMTGIDPNERDKKKLQEDLKFGRKVNIDHGIFISMYKTQLVKNALFEVSRFCFQNLRKKGNSASTFAEHWSNYQQGSLLPLYQNDGLTDNGQPVFGVISNYDDKDKIYEDIFKSIQGNQNALKPELISNFFIECGMLIVHMCKDLEEKTNLSNTTSNVDRTTQSEGSAACIAKSRIQQYRKAAAAAEQIEKQLEEMYEADKEKSIGLMISALDGEPVKFYDGKDPKQETIDEITNYTTNDFIQGGLNQSDDVDSKFKKCSDRPELAVCEGIVSNKEFFDKTKHDLENEMTLKREVEMARVRELVKKDQADLEKYLLENGYAEILKRYKEGNLKDNEIETEVGKSFESKKIALLEQMNAKMGKRQMSKSSTLSKGDIEDIKKETQEERARMGQVVMFNNIITSHLQFSKNKQKVGTNVNVWKKEEKSLENAQINTNLFQNIKETNADLKSAERDNSVLEIGILDTLLGN